MTNKTQLTIPNPLLPSLKQINARLQKNSDDFSVSFLFNFDDNICQIVGGHDPSYTLVTVALNEELRSHRKLADFSLSGDVFINWHQSALALKSITNEDFISLRIHYNAKQSTSHIIIYDTKEVSLPRDFDDQAGKTAATLENVCRRDITTEAPFARHIDFTNHELKRNYQHVDIHACRVLLQEAKPHIPLQMIEFDPDSNEMTVMRDGKIETINATLNIQLDHNLNCTEEGLEVLAHVIEHTSDKQVSFTQENDQLFIKTSEQCSAISLADIHEFKRKIEASRETLEVFTVDFIPFKAEVKSLRQYRDIKAYDIAMLVLQKENSYLITLVDEKTHTKPIQVSNLSLSSKERCVVQFHLSAFQDLKVRNITETKQHKVSIYKDDSSEYFLGFYTRSEDKTPAQSLPVLLIESKGTLKRIDQAIRDYQGSQLKNASRVSNKKENLELDLDSMF